MARGLSADHKTALTVKGMKQIEDLQKEIEDLQKKEKKKIHSSMMKVYMAKLHCIFFIIL